MKGPPRRPTRRLKDDNEMDVREGGTKGFFYFSHIYNLIYNGAISKYVIR
jgi:hypothetical protein